MSATTIVTPAPPRSSTRSDWRWRGFWPATPVRPGSATACDLRQFFAWCALINLAVFELQTRPSGAVGPINGRTGPGPGHHRPAVIHRGWLLPHLCARRAGRALPRRARATLEDAHRVGHAGPGPQEPSAFIAQAAAGGVMDHALARLLGLLGLRVAEACSINIEDLSSERGHRIVTVVGKGSRLAAIPLPPWVGVPSILAAGQRISGPLLLTGAGGRMSRPAATRIVRRVARSARVTKHISPHSLRHSFIIAAFFFGHSDPRTTTRYDRARSQPRPPRQLHRYRLHRRRQLKP